LTDVPYRLDSLSLDLYLSTGILYSPFSCLLFEISSPFLSFFSCRRFCRRSANWLGFSMRDGEAVSGCEDRCHSPPPHVIRGMTESASTPVSLHVSAPFSPRTLPRFLFLDGFARAFFCFWERNSPIDFLFPLRQVTAWESSNLSLFAPARALIAVFFLAPLIPLASERIRCFSHQKLFTPRFCFSAVRS